MKKKLIDAKKYPPKCSYCLYGRTAPDGEKILCEKKGIVDGEDTCRAYKYDVLKRIPQKPQVIETADPDDFSL